MANWYMFLLLTQLLGPLAAATEDPDWFPAPVLWITIICNSNFMRLNSMF